jgi:DNA (cytosine-5)-methyltransferase 1
MKHVDLCSGIGGFALGFEWAGLSTPVLFCDIDPWCRKILAQHWPHVPIASDVKVLSNDPIRNVPDCDILTAGYPCQPFSVAGKRKGSEDDRHIWPYIRRIVAQKRPAWCVFENVYGHISMGLDEVLSDLEAESYAARAFVVPACGVNAPHKRDRLWIIARNMADPESLLGNGSTEHTEQSERQVQQSGECGSSKPLANPNDTGSQGRIHRRKDQERQDQHGHVGCSGTVHRQPIQGWWDVEPELGRVAHGIPNRTHRLKGLGNAIVPQIAEQIALTIRKVSE